MSFVSATNIWISYGLQEAVTEMGSRKSVSLQSRNEYHKGAYQHYIERVASETRSLDTQIMPVMNNEGNALIEFQQNY